CYQLLHCWMICLPWMMSQLTERYTRNKKLKVDITTSNAYWRTVGELSRVRKIANSLGIVI
uniref:Uncharacterized protein n=1 Tax=Fundulus heteroclitus TaxID=8078 RepID=A0A3Q2NUN8_FUNHE